MCFCLAIQNAQQCLCQQLAPLHLRTDCRTRCLGFFTFPPSRGCVLWMVRLALWKSSFSASGRIWWISHGETEHAHWEDDIFRQRQVWETVECFCFICLFAFHQKGKIDPKMATKKDVFGVFFRLAVWLKLSHWREDPLGTNFSVDWQAFQGFKRYHQQRHAKVLQDQLARPGLGIPCSSCQTFFCVGRWFPVDFRSHRCQKMAQNTFASMRIRVQMRLGAEES